MALGVRGCGGDTSPSTRSTRCQAHPHPKGRAVPQVPSWWLHGVGTGGAAGCQSLPGLAVLVLGQTGVRGGAGAWAESHLRPVVQTRGQCWVLLGPGCVCFLLEYLVAGHESICCGGEKSM